MDIQYFFGTPHEIKKNNPTLARRNASLGSTTGGEGAKPDNFSAVWTVQNSDLLEFYLEIYNRHLKYFF
jgi:hypothetical protein